MNFVVVLLIASSALALTSPDECPKTAQVGNYINYLHLFKEETDNLWNFYNANTEAFLFYHTIIAVASNPPETHHKVLLKLVDTNRQAPRTWFYMIWAVLNENSVLKNVSKFGKFSDKGATANDLLFNTFFQVVTNMPTVKIDCYEKVIKLEYINFYYLFTNYYKNGLGETAPAEAF